MAIDQTKLQALLGRAVVDIGANFHAALMVAATSWDSSRAARARADHTGRPGEADRNPRAVHSRMAFRDGRGCYVTYEAGTAQFSLSEEQALASSMPTCPAPSCWRRRP